MKGDRKGGKINKIPKEVRRNCPRFGNGGKRLQSVLSAKGWKPLWRLSNSIGLCTSG